MHHNEQSAYHSTELQPKVGRIAFFIRIEALFISIIGFTFLFFGPYILLDAFGSDRLNHESIALPTIGLVLLSFGLFTLKVASDFEEFEPWSYRWVEVLTRSSWRWSKGCQHLYSPEVRKAFHQPKFEYPDHPEYGYKIEERK